MALDGGALTISARHNERGGGGGDQQTRAAVPPATQRWTRSCTLSPTSCPLQCTTYHVKLIKEPFLSSYAKSGCLEIIARRQWH